MINENVTNVLQQITGITNSVVLKYPTTIVNAASGDIIVKLNISKLDSEEFEDIGIWDLSEFLSAFKLFSGERNVSVDNKVLTISHDKRQTNLISTEISMLESFNKEEKTFTSTESVPTVAEFTLSIEDMKGIKQASGVFKDLSELTVTSQDGSVNLSLGANARFNRKSNGYSVEIDAETSKEFTLNIPTENFNKLPNSDYTVRVKYNSTRDAYRLMLESNDIDMTVLIAVNK
jgi:hypothetical protein